MEEILHQLRLVVYPISFRVLYISGGAGFLPSTVPAIVWVFEFYTCLFFLEDTRGQETASQVSVFRCVGVSTFSKREVPWETVKKEMAFYPDKETKRTYTHTLLLLLMSLYLFIIIHNWWYVFYKHIVLHFYARNCLADLDISRAPFLSRTAPWNVEVKILVFENCCHAPASWSPPSGISKGIHLVEWFRIGYPPWN